MANGDVEPKARLPLTTIRGNQRVGRAASTRSTLPRFPPGRLENGRCFAILSIVHLNLRKESSRARAPVLWFLWSIYVCLRRIEIVNGYVDREFAVTV